ncbi:hypothetical protein DH2020_012215 [Rehmannia glutinosa]|uniref:BED-type domain-containing protein n=1 Tax=Rehmannia glutinosa TaxID=99300 RepID=A0ABR0X058_REHGL
MGEPGGAPVDRSEEESRASPMMNRRRAVEEEVESSDAMSNIESASVADTQDEFVDLEEGGTNDFATCKCKYCGHKYNKISSKTGTGNLRRHIETCPRRNTHDVGDMMLSKSVAPRFDPEHFRELLKRDYLLFLTSITRCALAKKSNTMGVPHPSSSYENELAIAMVESVLPIKELVENVMDETVSQTSTECSTFT